MSTQKIRWLDAIKGISILWIITCHLTESLLGTPCFGFPSVHWPPPGERFAQLLPMDPGGLWGLFLNALRYVGWLGNQGVQVFIVASGFGLMWSHLHKGGQQGVNRSQFYRRRVLRIYPMWVLAHLGFGLLSVAARRGFWLTKAHFWLSLVGIRFTSSSFFVLAPAWWFIPLLLQLYLLFPYLVNWMERIGINRFFAASTALALSVRAAGLYLFSDYLLPWSTGAIFITRLPEFAFGIWLAWHMKNAPEGLDRTLRSARGVMAAGFIYLLGTFASFFLFGAIFSKLLTAVGLFCLLYIALSKLPSGSGLCSFVGKHSYSLYLAHHPFISFLIHRHLPFPPPQRTLISVAAALTATVVTAFILEKLEQAFLRVIESEAGIKLLARRMRWAGILGCAGIAALYGVELLFRAYNPQEVLGWGERPSLQKHDEFGYNLIPGRTTRLRWESYDYVMQANHLGFPGPAYSERKNSDVFRVLVTGDAFASAEGVNTDEAWPRVLERMLRDGQTKRRAEVMNFAITGWGPLE